MKPSKPAVLHRAWLPCLLTVLAVSAVQAQTNPTPLTLPVNQVWGTTTFSSLPTGFAAWNGLSGGAITSQILAETSAPTGDATVAASAPTATGGCYGYAPAGDGRFGIVTSSNPTNGVDQLVMALNTVGQASITLAFDYINVVANLRIVGAAVQYRVGTSGGWTTISGANNPYVQSGGTAGDMTSVSLALPAAAENQTVVQIRWAVWRGSGTGNSSAFAVDNIAVTATGSALPGVTGISISGGPGYTLGDSPSVTVTLAAAPATTATVSVTSGAFATTSVTITAPNTSNHTDVTMVNDGMFTATATAVSGCSGAASTPSFTVTGTPAPSFAAAGGNVVNDAAGNNNAAIDPNESGIQLTIPIINSGTAAATGISATLTAVTSGVTVTTGTRGYPNLAVSATGSNTMGFVVAGGAGLTCGSTITFQLAVTAAEGSSTFNVNFTACPPSSADPYDPPANYYASATGSGATLKTQLHNIIDVDYWNGSSTNHRVRSYDDAKTALQLLDRDPANANNVILIYTGASVAKAWDAGVTWNREHQWPQSQGVGSSGPAFSDLHSLRPCNPSINSLRGNDSFGIGSGFWDPEHPAPHRGRVARSMMYMNTRYNGDNPSNLNLVLVNGLATANASELGDLAKLIEWAYAYPADSEERRRNATVFSNTLNPSYYQGNRNPFIDRPEFVWAIYGTSANDSKLYVGASAPADGASSANVNLGTVIVGATPPGAQTLTLNKIGAAPTSYDVSLSGAALSDAAGKRQTWIGGAQSRTVSAGLTASTAVAGLKTGSILIDNTDLTSSTNGTGSADGNDVVSISETVLDHANASFASPTDQNALTINFGNVTVGGAPVNQNFTLYNLTATVGFTAALDLDTNSGSGDTTKLTTNIAPFTNLAAGGNHAYTATLTPNVVGAYSATYTLVNSDENLPGAQAGTNLVLTLTANVIASACDPYDVNCSGAANAADLSAIVALLINGGAPCSACAGDANNDHVLDGSDIQLLVNQILVP